MNAENPKITVGGVEFEWDQARGLMLAWGMPVLCLWIQTTMAGMMSGLHKLVGTELFQLAAQAAGEQSTQGEWDHIIMRSPTVEEGLRFIGKAAASVGLGEWELVSLDYEKKEARFRSVNSWEGLFQQALGVCWGSGTLGGKFSGYCKRIFGTDCWPEQVAFAARGDPYDEFIIRASDVTVEQRIREVLQTDSEDNIDLGAALARLRQEVADRKQIADKLEEEIAERKATEAQLLKEVEERAQVEQELRSKLAIIRRQEEAIRAMSMPILQLWNGILTMPVIGVMDAPRADQMMENLLDEITKTQARFTILDVTGVDSMDTSAAGHLLKLVQAARLLGTRCLVSGISPTMAQSMVALGLDLGELATFGTLAAALHHAIDASGAPTLPGRTH